MSRSKITLFPNLRSYALRPIHYNFLPISASHPIPDIDWGIAGGLLLIQSDHLSATHPLDRATINGLQIAFPHFWHVYLIIVR